MFNILEAQDRSLTEIPLRLEMILSFKAACNSQSVDLERLQVKHIIKSNHKALKSTVASEKSIFQRSQPTGWGIASWRNAWTRRWRRKGERKKFSKPKDVSWRPSGVGKEGGMQLGRCLSEIFSIQKFKKTHLVAQWPNTLRKPSKKSPLVERPHAPQLRWDGESHGAPGGLATSSRSADHGEETATSSLFEVGTWLTPFEGDRKRIFYDFLLKRLRLKKVYFLRKLRDLVGEIGEIGLGIDPETTQLWHGDFMDWKQSHRKTEWRMKILQMTCLNVIDIYSIFLKAFAFVINLGSLCWGCGQSRRGLWAHLSYSRFGSWQTKAATNDVNQTGAFTSTVA